MARGRIADDELEGYENEIAALNSIMQEARALTLDLDVDTLAYVQRRLTKILETAARLKRRRIEAMNEAKDAARESRSE